MIEWRFHSLAGGVLVLFAAVGCIPSEPPPENEGAARATPEALVEEWLELAKTAKENANNPRCFEIAGLLTAYGPDALAPLLDVVADPDSDPHAKLLATLCLEGAAHPEMLPRLIALTRPEHDGTTRACATKLLGRIQDPQTDALLKGLFEDPERRVRLAAWLGMTARGDAEARRALLEHYVRPDANLRERAAILSVLASHPQASDLRLLMVAVNDKGLTEDSRVLAVAALGRLGDPSVIEALRKCAEQEPEGAVRSMVETAIEALEARQAAE